MKFDAAIQALVHTAWDWTEDGFAAITNQLGFAREKDAAVDMPGYITPWGKEWAQATIEDGAVERLEILIEEKSPMWRAFTSRKLIALERKFRVKHAAYVKRIAAVKGTPTFIGEHAASGFPADEDAHVLALWPAENARLMLTLRNEGRDTPFWISIVVRPPATGRAPTVRPSSMTLRAAPIDIRFDAAIRGIQGSRWDWTGDNLGEDVDRVGILPTPGTDPQRFEFIVQSISPPPGGFDPLDLDALDDDYTEKFESYVARAQKVLGKPKFNDGRAARGFPKDENAQVLALWQLANARVMLLHCNDGSESPFTISIVVRPR